MTQWGEARSEWNRTGDGMFGLKVTVPVNTRAEVRLPDGEVTDASGTAERRGEGVFGVPSGAHVFEVRLKQMGRGDMLHRLDIRAPLEKERRF